MSTWQTVPLGSAIKLQRGFDLPHRLRRPGSIPVVSSAGIIDYNAVSMVNPPGVVTGRYGTIGELFFLSEPFWPLNTTLFISNFQKNDPRFIYYLLQRFDFASFSGKSGVPGVNRNDLYAEPVSLPSNVREQRAIAEALSDVDALLGAQDRLIAKKRDIKQAAMQQLLTGQTRLPGFGEEWQQARLSQFGSTYGGLIGKTKSDFGTGPGFYVSFMDVMNNVTIRQRVFDRVRISRSETQNRVLKGDILFNGSSETPEEVALCSVIDVDVPDLYLNSFCFGFRLREHAQADGLFLAYYFRSREGRELIKSLAQGSTRYNISKVALLKATLHLPASKAEQTAIATALSDMESEIAAGESRRAKTIAIKQGMMQQLLTGRTRLV